MLNITVSDIEKAPLVLDKWAGRAIGLIDPEYKDAMPKRKQYLQLYFHDVSQADEAHDGNLVIPEQHHIQRVLEFSSGFSNDDKILVHCHAGISRSSAVAITVHVQHGLEPFEAFYAVQRVCPDMYPNRLILQHADVLLRKEGGLIGYLDVWLANFNPTRPTAHPLLPEK